jgi:TM2 domain-containing membrane protein YozV
MDKRIIAAIMSFLIPGLGQFYCGLKVRGIVAFLGALLINIASAMLWLPINLIVPFVVAWDAYRVAPKINVDIMLWQKMALAAFIFAVLAIISLKSGNEFAPILAIVFLIASLIATSMMRAEHLQAAAISRVRNTIIQMGFAPNEVEEITRNVVRILRAGGSNSISGDSTDPLGKMSDALVSVANWTNFSGAELSSVIRTVLDIRDRKKAQP